MTRIAIERALAWVEKEKEKKFFMITYGDTGVWCQCPNCLALDPAPGEYATHLLSSVNPIARAIAAQFPDKIIMTFAYGGSDVAPLQIRPETNVWVVGSTGLGNVRFWDHALNAREPLADNANVEKANGWLKVAPHQYLVCEYVGGQYEPCLVDNAASRLRWYGQHGLKGIFATYGLPANFPQLWDYLFSRLMWNPEQDALAVADEYITRHYGTAAAPVARFFELVHKRYKATLDEGSQMADPGAYLPGFYQDAFVRQALACFAEAEGKTGGDSSLKLELESEEKRFLQDAASHLPSYDLSPESNRELLSLFDRSQTLA